MIGLDTNVLLRAFVNDDVLQGQAARQLLADERRSPKYVGLIVLVEFAWSLRRTYGYTRQAVLEAIRRLLDASDTVVQRRELVSSCVVSATTTNSEFADLLIALGNIEDGCSVTVTFDSTAARRIPSMELLA